MTGELLVLPRRHQRRRTGGWSKPAGAVIVDRTTKHWGNPFRVGEAYPTSGGPFGQVELLVTDREMAAGLYRGLLLRSPDFVEKVRRELAGKELCCPCPLTDCCHADVLIACANNVPYWQVIPLSVLRLVTTRHAA